MTLFPRPRLARNRRSGAVTVEMAIVIPVFFLFIFALVELGRGMMVVNLLTNAARSGCRQGILSGTTNDDIASAVNAALTSHGLKDPTITVKVNGAAANASTALPQDEVTVSISVPVAKNTWLPFVKYLKGDLTGQFTLTRE